MPRPCSVCVHPQRSEIEATLVAGRSTFRSMAERFGTSKTALFRHKQEHLPVGLVKAQHASEVAEADDLLGQVQELQSRTIAILARAEEVGDLRTALQAIRESRGNLELLARLVAAAMLSQRMAVDDADNSGFVELSGEALIAEITRLAGGPWPAAGLLPPTDDELPPGYRRG